MVLLIKFLTKCKQRHWPGKKHLSPIQICPLYKTNKISRLVCDEVLVGITIAIVGVVLTVASRCPPPPRARATLETCLRCHKTTAAIDEVCQSILVVVYHIQVLITRETAIPTKRTEREKGERAKVKGWKG